MKLSYWLGLSLKTAGLVLLAGLIYTGMFSLMEHEPSGASPLSMCAGYATALGLLICFVLAISLNHLYIPLSISFGATRKEVFCGVQLCRITYSLLVSLAGCLLLLLSEEVSPGKLPALIPLLLGLHLACHAIGGILAVVYAKFRVKGMVLGIILVVIGFAAGLVTFITAVDGGTMPELSPGLGFPVLAVGAAVSLLEAPLEAKTILRCNVKL